jgi:hypothetical protein
MQDDAQQRGMDLQVAVVVDEAQPPELVHEGVNARTGRADDLRQRLLADLRGDRLRLVLLAEVGEEEKRAGQALFARTARTLDAEADGGRPTALRLALSTVSVGVEHCGDHPTGDRHPVASDGLSDCIGASRIHGELLKLGFQITQSTVTKYMARSGRGRSQTWKTFLHNHAASIGAMDFLIVLTAGFACSSSRRRVDRPADHRGFPLG